MQIKIGECAIGNGLKPLIVAELSGNHQQSYQLAKSMIEAAAQAGADAIKFQTYTADTMTLDIDSADFVIQEQQSLWHGESLHSLYAKAATPWEWHQPLFDYAKQLGMLAFSSPFDESAVDFLETLGVPCYKVASFELTDLPLIKKIAQTGKPVIMSTGMASIEEIEQAIAMVKDNQGGNIVLLKCTSTYPADIADSHLNTLPDMAKRFGQLVGLSDHTRGIVAPVASVALGACLIEKHFVLDRSAGGVDAEFSLEPNELEQLVESVRQASQALGSIKYGGTCSEEKSKQYRRSIYVKKPIKAGEVFSKKNVQIVRPAFGLEPKYWESVLGKVATIDLEAGTPLGNQHLGEPGNATK